tara:strand:- start:7054 stop:7536 length:483 start_codon:yes stop_codon:yes gene_type:complete
MAHFAECKTDNDQVLRVVVVDNADVDANGGDLSAQAEQWVTDNIVPCEHVKQLQGGTYPDTYWKQTSYNNNFRTRYATIDGFYKSGNDKFTEIQPYASWALDSNDEWQAPVAYPTTTTYGDNIEYLIKWDEDNQRWLGLDQSENEFVYDPSSDSWSATGN